MNLLKSAAAVFVGLLLISVIVEPIEFLLVGLAGGGFTTDPEAYFAVRNRPGILAAKLGYNTLGAIAGGYVAARLAPGAPLGHGVVLAIVQTLAFGWALITPEIRETTPDWMWSTLIVATAAGILWGAMLHAKRQTR
jgi:hypothetical protein